MRFKILVAMLIIVGATVLIPIMVGAQMEADIAKQAGYETDITDTAVSETIGKIIRSVLSFVGTIFLVLTVYAGILWMTASGNDEQVNKALGIIKMAVIGFVITMSAYSIVTFVMIFALPKPAASPSNAPKCDALRKDFSAGGVDNGNAALDPAADDGAGAKIGKSLGCATVTLGATLLSPISWLWKTKW